MAEITSISQFLSTAKTQFQVYDLGRRVQHIDAMAFAQIEALQAPYPYPIQGHAKMALVFWDASEQHFVWFISLPLDERGLLSPAPRSQFIRMILEALGQDLTRTLSEEEQQKMANHPFSFKPTQEKLAVFNALVRRHLGRPASAQYEFAAQYLSGQLPAEHWPNVGFQGLADISVRLSELDHETMVVRSLKGAPAEVQIALCQCLEHVLIPEAVTEALLEGLAEHRDARQIFFLRALGSQADASIQAVTLLAAKKLLTEEVLVCIAGRNWLALRDDNCRKTFLEALALTQQDFFNQVFADIVAIPALRTAMLTAIRDPNRSDALSRAIGGLFKATKS
ncbi:DUF3549 family protein [Shewanella khirikhana]|uniref:DUF3549 domain-containing protein n=1 Tax=Shewanella khirikhana TaxID=1965282 RepID=A0ABM7D0D1_9GAMM|nr:DUF3549 family protein [Shewanella khirikhana]AZQ09823.1 hypothetical protein STH12_00684 [Shewanella khirikhana]